MHPAMMLVGLGKAIGRFVGDEGAVSLEEALRLGLENRHRPDAEELLRTAYKNAPKAEWDLDEELTTLERYFALFEALNWAVSLDDRLALDWPYEEISYGEYWCDEFVGGGLIRGLRSVRNAVHHDWALALDMDPVEVPFCKRIDLLCVRWLSGLPSRDDRSRGATAYLDFLAGRVVGDTLLEIDEIFESATQIVMGGLPRRPSGPARIKRCADDIYRPEAAG
jgi:hypothetical protein